jgi:hypothetical protein
VRHVVAFLTFAGLCLLLFGSLASGDALAGQTAAEYPTAGAAVAAMVQRYEEQIDPAHPLFLGELHQDDEWAYLIAQPTDPATGEFLPGVIPILARRTGDIWEAIAPALAPPAEFNAWLDAVSPSLMDASLKGYLQLYDPARAPVAYFSGHFLPWPGGRWGEVTQRDGSGHYGQIDFAIERDVYSSKPGRVVFIKESSPDPDEPCSNFELCWRKANVVVIQHAPQEFSWYVHLAYNSVPDNIYVGLDVPAGVKIGVEGRTGYTWGETGYHLHYMVSAGHYPWTDPNDPDALTWATGIERTDFIERRWEELEPRASFLSQNYTSYIPPRSSVDGIVRDSAGRLSGGATVVLLSGDGQQPPHVASTDGLGTYKFQHVIEGDYVAGAGRNGFWQMVPIPAAGLASLDAPALVLSRACGSGGSVPLESEIEALVCEDATAAPPDGTTTPAATPLVLAVQPGVDNVLLRWEPANSIAASQYRILRAVGDSATFSSLALTPEIFYIDTATVQPDTRGCYRVQAQRANGTVVATSNDACTAGQTLSLWVPHVEARLGDRVLVPVNIDNAHGLRLASSSIALDYDPRLLALRGVAPGVLSGGYDWYTSVSSSGDLAQVRVSSLSTQTPLLYGSGALFWLIFDVLPSDVISSPLNLREYVPGGGGSTIYTPANPSQPLPLMVLDGNLYVEPQQAYGRGDVNGDGAVTVADGAVAVRVASNMLQATARQLRAAAITGNGRVDAADGSAILRYAAQGSWPAAQLASSLAAPAAPAAPAVVRINDATGIQGALVQTTLQVSGAGAWAGGTFWLAYDPALVAGVVDVIPAGIAAGQHAAFDDPGTGLARIILSSAAPLAADGAIAQVTLRVGHSVPTGTTTPLALVAAALNDGNGQDYATSSLQTTVTPVSGTLHVDYVSAYLPVVRR